MIVGVRGFIPLNEAGPAGSQADPDEELIRELSVKKQNFLLEIANYEQNARLVKSSETSKTNELSLDLEGVGAIPANTQLTTTLYVNPGSESEQPCIELFVSTSNDTVIRGVLVFAEGVFPGESYVVLPPANEMTNSLKVQLRPEKDMAVDLHVKALVGHKHSIQYHVFELDRSFPKFSFYALCNENAPQPKSHVTFTVNERPQRLALWINDNFLLQEELTVRAGNRLDAKFFSLRGSGMLCLQADASSSGGGSGSGAAGGGGGSCHIFVRCDDMDVCGEVVQALAEFFGLADLNTTAEFPMEIDRLTSLLTKTSDLYLIKDRLTAEAADYCGLIKGLLIRAEDSRLLDDISTMKRYYTEIYGVNKQIIAQQKIRSDNQEELRLCLKEVNQIIQRAGRLRVGKTKTNVINACRNAIKDGNAAGVLPKIIRMGA